MKYRKKPVVIEAVQWTGGNIDEMVTFAGHAMTHEPDFEVLIIPTLEGKMRASPMDWIIRGVKNELYPCKPDIFEATYEAVT